MDVFRILDQAGFFDGISKESKEALSKFCMPGERPPSFCPGYLFFIPLFPSPADCFILPTVFLPKDPFFSGAPI